MIRKPIVAGQFYPGEKTELLQEIRRCFASELGPGKARPREKVLGAVVPHAGYPFSGACAAHSYNAIRDNQYDLFIILGFSHSGLGTSDAGTMLADWETPLGIAKVDADFTKLLVDKTPVEIDDNAHLHEHSIEVQLPFLQFIFDDFRFVPVSVSHSCDFAKTGKAVAEAIKGSKKKVCVLASSDFTHYGMSYGYVPFTDDVKERLKKLDMGAVELITRLDSKSFLDYVIRNEATICGYNAIALQIEILKSMGARRGELLKYYTSADIIGDYSNSVSYVSMVFEP